MNVLALDTASPLPAIALACGADVSAEPLAQDRHSSEALLPALNGLLRRAGIALAQVSRIAVCSGPGSFTGLRIGLATAWGLGRALSIPVESLSTLEAMAEASRSDGLDRVAAVLDAGRGEASIGVFELSAERARLVGRIERLPMEKAAGRFDARTTICLPPELLGFPTRGLDVLPAIGAARAVARAPRDAREPSPTAIYGRPSAAEEKLGAS